MSPLCLPALNNIFSNSCTKTSFKAPIHPHDHKMTSPSTTNNKQRPQQKGCSRALCCTCRLSISSASSSTTETSNSSEQQRFPSISSLAHAMVQERLDQLIKDSSRERRPRQRTMEGNNTDAKFIVMVALEKSSDDPRHDFRESMIEMVKANKIHEPKDLRGLLNYYVSMNSEEYHSLILQVFHEVCSNMFLRCKWQLQAFELIANVRSNPHNPHSLKVKNNKTKKSITLTSVVKLME